MDQELKETVQSAIATLRRNDLQLLKLDAHEQSISHKLAEYLQEELNDWHVDCEYNRYYDDEKELPESLLKDDPDEDEDQAVRPDIIVHERDSQEDNLLIIEMKKDSDPDEDRMNAFIDEIGYEYGAFINLQTGQEPRVEPPQWFSSQ